jgi:hypothetical protein
LYTPSDEYVCVGDWLSEYDPSPKLQFQALMVPLLLESVNRTDFGDVPLVEFAEKLAFNG